MVIRSIFRVMYSKLVKKFSFFLRIKAFSQFWRFTGNLIARDSDLFAFYEKFGLHITLNHYYSPIPDTRTLKDELWEKKSELIGININEDAQIKLLSLFSSKFKTEYEKFPTEKPSDPFQYYINNGAFDSVDAEILYCMIRHFKPKKILEIGSGYSTLLSAQGVQKNKEIDDFKSDLISIEPYPRDFLKSGFPGLTKLMIQKVQDIPLMEFQKLTENDILFIDSSHALKIGGDVQYEYLEILPRLNKGVLIHIHDIFLPAEYPRGLIFNHTRFWNEQYLLQAFLTFNNNFEILWAGSYMHLTYPNKLEQAFSTYDKDITQPGSFWMRRI